MSKKPEISELLWSYDLIHRRQWPEWYKKKYVDGWTPVQPRGRKKREQFWKKKREKMAKYYRESRIAAEERDRADFGNSYEEARRRYEDTEGRGSKTRRKRKVRRKSRKSRSRPRKSRKSRSRRRKSRKSRRRR